MAPPVKDVLLIGFGALGTMYSYILKKSGLARVTVVARSNYDVVNAHGMNINSVKYGEISAWRPDRLMRSVADAADRPYSYVVVTTKAIPELVRTPTILAPLLSAPYVDEHPQPTYVVMQNGLNVERDLYNSLKALNKGDPSIIGTIAWIGANLTEKNSVRHNHFDRVSLGIYRHGDHMTTTNSPEEALRLQDFGSMLEAGGTTLTIVSEIQRVKFTKNFWNVAFSSFATLTGYRLPALFRPPPGPEQSYEPFVSPLTAEHINSVTIPTLHAILRELVALGRAMGFPDSDEGLPSSLVETTVENTRKLHILPDSQHRPSMLLDMEKGLPLEVEVIIGEVVRMAKTYNVDVPRIETLYALLLVVQNQILRKMNGADANVTPRVGPAP